MPEPGKGPGHPVVWDKYISAHWAGNFLFSVAGSKQVVFQLNLKKKMYEDLPMANNIQCMRAGFL